MTDDWLVLTGQSEALLREVDESTHRLHGDVLPYWQALVWAAADAGFTLRLVSAWRGFERQRAIWNGKVAGQRVVLDGQGRPLDIATLSEEALLFAILRWSALPGCSRHHWGSDMDVYDAGAVSDDYQIQLTPAECADCGPFAPLHAWLDKQLAQPGAAFFRPYARDTGGIAPERWHLSCRPVAARYETQLDERKMLDWLMTQDIALKHVIREHWSDIFRNYIKPVTVAQ